jgi:hypothetical protein
MYHSVNFNVRDPIHSPGLKFPEADLFNIARYLSKTCKSHPDRHLCNILAVHTVALSRMASGTFLPLWAMR